MNASSESAGRQVQRRRKPKAPVLSIVQKTPVQSSANRDVVEFLEEMLMLARSGSLSGVVGAFITNGNFKNFSAGECKQNRALAAGGVAWLLHQVSAM